MRLYAFKTEDGMYAKVENEYVYFYPYLVLNEISGDIKLSAERISKRVGGKVVVSCFSRYEYYTYEPNKTTVGNISVGTKFYFNDDDDDPNPYRSEYVKTSENQYIVIKSRNKEYLHKLTNILNPNEEVIVLD